VSNLNEQQFGPDEVAVLRAGDFPGSIGDQAARRRFKRYNEAESMRSEHREAGGALEYLDQFTQKVRQDGKINKPVEVLDMTDHYQIWNGHHRALAAHELGLPLPYKVKRK
jgi:hypothetical protein